MLGLSEQVPRIDDFFAPEQIVGKKAEDAMATADPVLDGDLDSLASKISVVTVSHCDVLHVENH